MAAIRLITTILLLSAICFSACGGDAPVVFVPVEATRIRSQENGNSYERFWIAENVDGSTQSHLDRWFQVVNAKTE
jgi:hypothetical protein